MGIDTLFSNDIIIDEDAFNTAISEFSELSEKLQRLRNDIEDMLNNLQAGFDTPAGAKFIKACRDNLYIPLDAQKLVLKHISTTLQESKQAYESVFREYENLQSTINKINNN